MAERRRIGRGYGRAKRLGNARAARTREGAHRPTSLNEMLRDARPYLKFT